MSSGPELQVLIETDILGEFLVSSVHDRELRLANEPRLLRALRMCTCYTTMLNAYELLRAARSDDEHEHIYRALSLVRVLGFNARTSVNFAALARKVELERGITLSMRDAFILGMAEQSKLSILTETKHDLFTSAHIVPVLRDVATNNAAVSRKDEKNNGSENILTTVGIGKQ